MTENPKKVDDISITGNHDNNGTQLEKRVDELEKKAKELQSFQNTICVCLCLLTIAFIIYVLIWPMIAMVIGYINP
jgi:ABC-type transport system involved in cytochrome bd biosynthesis fused ATPase/permease subunit